MKKATHIPVSTETIFLYEKIEKTANSYAVQTRYYRNHSCEGCPHVGKCHKSQRGFREITVSPEFVKQRRKTLENITTEEGTRLRVNRSIQVKGVFGILKQDFGFKRFFEAWKVERRNAIFSACIGI